MKWSQMFLAKGLNVSVKTVQAWEQGLRKPVGPTLKLLEIAEKNPEIHTEGIKQRPPDSRLSIISWFEMREVFGI